MTSSGSGSVPDPDPGAPRVFWAEHLWSGVGDEVRHGVLVEVTGDRVSGVLEGVAAPPGGATVLRGVTLPGLVDAHSHAFHRALRGRTQADRGSFWTWRDLMYQVAARLTPENYEQLATAVFAEMALGGVTAVGEFHYVHHRADGSPHDDPIAMARALVRAAATAGVRLTLLDTCYLVGGFAPGDVGPDVGLDAHVPLSSAQRRFGDGTAEAWAERATAVRDSLTAPTVVVGAAVHSVRAVPEAELATVAAWAHAHDAPLHAHVSEQPAENDDCRRLLGASPVEVLTRHGVLGRRSTAVHATHLTRDDVALLASADVSACFCVTTERDLADGVGPAGRLADAGVPLTVGSDSHAVSDLFEEARGIETGERVTSGRRGRFSAAELLVAATSAGARSLGWDDAGTLVPGALADLTTVSLDSVRLSDASDGALLEAVVFAATAADVDTVVVGGEVVVAGGRHLRVPDVAGALRRAVAEVAS